MHAPDDDEETFALLLKLKELRCARLHALIDLKEARLREARLREARLKSLAPATETAVAVDAPADALPAPSPVPLRRKSSSLVNVEVPGPNANPLGKLQPLGRKEYRPAATTRFGARSHFPAAGARHGLLPSGLPTALVQRWHAGAVSGDLALREVLDAVCRARSGRDASPEERELSTMTHAFSADGVFALGGALGGLVGGLPLARGVGGGEAVSDLAPLSELLYAPRSLT
jgi:hypothetical protein